MTAQPSSQAEREDVARKVLAEAMDTCVSPHANEIAFLARHSRDLLPKRTTATIIAAMLAFSDREHATPRSMPEEVVEAYERAAKVADAARQQQEDEGEGGGREWCTAQSIALRIRALIPGASA